MLTFLIIFLLEGLLVAMRSTVDADLAAIVLCVPLAGIMATAWHDTEGSYIRAVAYAVSVGWYCSSIPRYLDQINPIYAETWPAVGFFLSVVVLIVAPGTLIMTPLVRLASSIWTRE